MLGWWMACAHEALPVDSGGDDTGLPTGDTSADTAAPPFEGRLGRTWRFDLTTADIPEPADAGELLRSYLGSHLLVQVAAEDTAAMTLRLAWSDGSADEQAPGVPTVDVAADTNEGAFTTEPAEHVLHALDDMPVEQAVLAGTMSADYARVDDASLVLLGDTAALMEILSEEEPEAFCEMLEGLGGACETCGSGAETCAWFTFAGMTGVDVSPLDLVAVGG